MATTRKRRRQQQRNNNDNKEEQKSAAVEAPEKTGGNEKGHDAGFDAHVPHSIVIFTKEQKLLWKKPPLWEKPLLLLPELEVTIAEV